MGAVAQVASTVITGAGTTVTATLTTTSGNLLYCCGFQEADNAATFTAPSHTFTDRGSIREAVLTARITHGEALAIPGGSTTVTATFAGSGPFREIVMVECSGLATSAAVDDDDETTDTGTNPTSTATMTSTVTAGLGLAFGVDLQSTGLTPGSGWSDHALYFNSATEYTIRLQKKTISATGSVTSNFGNTTLSRTVATHILLKDDTGPVAQKITELGARGTPAMTDLLYLINDPAGTPTDKKCSLTQLLAGFIKPPVVTRITATGSGTYTPTAGMVKVLVRAQGGGGGGRSATATDEAGGGGGGGGYVEKLYDASFIGASKGYSVGAGGAANAAGSDTTFNTTSLVAGGGGTGSVTGSSTTLGTQAAGGAGGTATGGDINIPGEPGGRGTIYSTTHGRGGYGGDSHLGTGGAPGVSDSAGAAGTGKGSGGAGGHASGTTDRAGGAGMNGTIEFWEFID